MKEAPVVLLVIAAAVCSSIGTVGGQAFLAKGSAGSFEMAGPEMLSRQAAIQPEVVSYLNLLGFEFPGIEKRSGQTTAETLKELERLGQSL